MKEERFKKVRVTVEEDYIIPIYDDTKTKINGWSLKEVIKSWFGDYNLNSFHATRDTYRIGGSRKFIKSEIIE